MMEPSNSEGNKPRFDVYDIDGTLTRPGFDLWYLTTKELASDPEAFDNRVQQWKQEVAETGDVVGASETMMQDAVQNFVRKDASQSTVLDMARKISLDLIQRGLVFSEWFEFCRERLQQGVTPVLATTNYLEGAQAFVQALVESKWLTPEAAQKFQCSGTVIDWENGRTILHFNIHKNKCIGIQDVTQLSSEDLADAVENVFGDDPAGNDYGILTMTHHHSWIVHTAKNAGQDWDDASINTHMQRMSWLHWTDAAKHRVPQGLMNIFGQQEDNSNDSTDTDNLETDLEQDPKCQPLLDGSNDDKTRVVIVGGGFCGVIVTQMLQQQQSEDLDLDITLVDPKPSFEYVGAMPKSLAQQPSTMNDRQKGPVGLPFDQIISVENINVRHVRGWVETVKENHVVVRYINKAQGRFDVRRKDYLGFLGRRKLAFDHLVLATGSTYPAGIKSSHLTALHGITRGIELERQRKKVFKAQTILLIGGGYVGIEIATEIAANYPKKQVTLVDRYPRLLPRLPGAHEVILKRMEDLGIKVVLGETITHIDPKSLQYVTDTGRTFSCDHAIWCGGPQPNNTLVPSIQKNLSKAEDITKAHNNDNGSSSSALSRGCLVVDEYLNLHGSNGQVWCGGDACILDDGVGEEAMAARAMRQGRVIAANIIASVKTKNGGEEDCRQRYEHEKTTVGSMNISLGGDQAIVVIDDVPVVGPFRGLKEEMEQLLLDQLASMSSCKESVDPYVVLNKVNVETLRKFAKEGKTPRLQQLMDSISS